MKTRLQRQPLLQDGDKDVDGHRDPDLNFDRILAIAVKRLDSEVHLDPFEKQLHGPPGFVQQAKGERGQIEVVGDESEVTVLVGVVEVNPAQRVGVVLARGRRGQHDGVVGTKASRWINLVRVAAKKQDAAFGARDEEGAGAVEGMGTREVDVGAIHHVEGGRLGHDHVEDVDVVPFAAGNLDKRRDRTTYVEQRVHFDGRLAGAKAGPRKHRQAEIDGGRVERVDRIV